MPLFDDICHLAKTKDTQTLIRKINEEKICIDVQEGICRPVTLFAQQGQEEVVTFLISGFNANRDWAVRGYAQGGHTAQVDALLAQGANRDDAVRGYAQGGHTANSEKLLRVMTLTDNKSLRNALSQKAPNNTSSNISHVLLKKSHNLTRLMKENHLSYPWARVFTPTLNFLFLQGHLLMKKGKLPLEMLLEISSFISGFSVTNTHAMLSRHYVPHSNQLKAGRNTSLFRRQALLVNTIASSEKNFLLVPVTELTVEDKSLTVPKSELRALLYEEYPKKRHTFLSHGACSKILNLDGSTTIKQLKALLENTPGDAISLEAVRKAIHRTKIDFSNNDEKSGTDFVFTQIKEKFIDAARKQQHSASNLN